MAAAYTYDLLGRKVKEELPQNKTDGSAGYQTVVNEYDKSGNLVETKEQIEGDKNKEIEYTYDKQGNLVQVKSSLENEKAQYVQYVYDEQGNKVRRFTGMTGPLTVTVAAVENAKDDAGKDTFTYGGKTYAVLVTGKRNPIPSGKQSMCMTRKTVWFLIPTRKEERKRILTTATAT